MEGTPNAEVDRVMNFYPDGGYHVPCIALDSAVTRLCSVDPTQSSPFNAGERNRLSPQFKRMAALIGDMVFIAPRRYFAQSRSDKQPVYVFSAFRLSLSFLNPLILLFKLASERFKGLEHLGAAHSSDLMDPFSGGVTADYFIQFITHADPNRRSTSDRSILSWPKHSNELPSMMRFFHGDMPVSIGLDDYRKAALDNWNRLVLENRPGPP